MLADIDNLMSVTDLACAVRAMIGEDGWRIELIGRHVSTTECERLSALTYSLEIRAVPEHREPGRVWYFLREDLSTESSVLDAAREFVQTHLTNRPHTRVTAGREP
jgi:hypothetical protein